MATNEKIKFEFPEGILGFENIKEFNIFESGYEPFLIMESLNEEISFLLTSPLFFLKEYNPEINKFDLENMQLDNNEHTILCIVNMHVDDYMDITANLKAPIILNKKKFIGKQIIVDNEDYSINHKIFKRDN